MPHTPFQPTRSSIFDLARSPLEGLNLIDASAGTGKTYAICGLVLRLLLEKHLTIEQVLVVTYTEAATEDLRDRIRQRLRQALSALSNPPGNDEFLREYLADIKDCKNAAQLLSEALRSFDQAAIFTIHGFCQRMLLENSFESNTLFDTELVADDSYLIREIIEDYWRHIFSRSSDLLCQYIADKLTPDALLDFLTLFIPHHFLQFIPDLEPAAACNHLSGSETEYISAYRTICQEWLGARQEVCQDLLNSHRLKRNIYKKTIVPVIISNMDEMASACLPSPHLFDRFLLLTSSRITAGTKLKETPNILPFYELCENLAQARDNLLVQYDRCLLALKKRLFDSFRHQLSLRKERDNVFSFDDLLQRLHGALSGPGGNTFAKTVAQKYPAVLIDEFQDTDPLQFEIFNKLYSNRSLFFLIGDPKQAIYSFRGADIFTYMDAAADSLPAHHTLGVNYRSSPALVKAVNTIFSRAQKPFIFNAISFQPAAAAQKQVSEQLVIDGQQEEPLILWFLDKTSASGEDATAFRQKNLKIPKNIARKHIISLVAAEICRLLSLASDGRIRINDRKLLPGDMAILVRKNIEARKMQQALTDLQVPSVLNSGADLFSSEEAKELALFLGAISAPNSSIPRLKTGLLTRFIGLQVNEISLLQSSSPESDIIIGIWLKKFRKYHELWQRYGFMQMFWTVMRENHVRQRLLAAENGERSLTNILHLAEILHQEASNRGLNMTSLIGYLRDRLTDDQGKNIEHQLRLESDEDRVKIVTIHKAKGLEYPIVFCPFTWEGLRTDAKKSCLFHLQRPDDKTMLIFDAGSSELETHLEKAQQEEMAENLRLLYVALTRAVHRCYFVWGPISGAETSAPAYLLHQGSIGYANSAPESNYDNTLMKKVASRFSGLSTSEILADLQELAGAAQGTIRISTPGDLPEKFSLDNEERKAPLHYRKFSAAIDRDWKISSFSSLTANRSSLLDNSQSIGDIVSDRDELPALQPMSARQREQKDCTLDIFTFPHGSRPGTFLHELLEQADFSNVVPLGEDHICKKLQYFGYEKIWYPVIAHMLEDLCNVQLHDEITDLKLSNIPAANCLHELEFYFPLARLTPEGVKRIFIRKDPYGASLETAALMDHQLDRLNFSPSRGFMRGFIDLVFEFGGRFYLVDWKSNYLGPDIEDYRRGKLFESVLSGLYFLQYHIYCLALHLYLKKRLSGYSFESHFGGVFYIYLRGVNQNLGPEYGIYHDRPDLSTIELWEARFITGKET